MACRSCSNRRYANIDDCHRGYYLDYTRESPFVSPIRFRNAVADILSLRGPWQKCAFVKSAVRCMYTKSFKVVAILAELHSVKN